MTRGLLFPFKDVLEEFEIVKKLAHGFIDPTTVAVLDETRGNLAAIQTTGSTTKTTPWRILPERPLRTIWSAGESARDAQGAFTLRAELSFVWDIRPIVDEKWGKRKLFALDGNASTVVSLKGRDNKSAEGNEVELVCWRIEVGDHQSPGTHFHVQLNSYDLPPFPKSLDVPRLPALLMSPLLVFEFALGELFQDRWARTAVEDNQFTRRWRTLHSPRLDAFFNWQRQRINGKVIGTPVAVLKSDRPSADLIVKASK
jgi:hypothetical protein